MKFCLHFVCFECQFDSFDSVNSFIRYSAISCHVYLHLQKKNQHVKYQNGFFVLFYHHLYQSVHLSIIVLSLNVNVILLHIRFNVAFNIHKVQLLYTLLIY